MKSKLELAASDLPDHVVDGLPHIVPMIEAIEREHVRHTAAVAAVTASNRELAAFRAMAPQHEQLIRDQEAIQATVALGCVQGDAESLRKWADAEAEISRARQFLRQHHLASPEYEAGAAALQPKVTRLADSVNGLLRELNDARFEAKLEICRAEATQ